MRSEHLVFICTLSSGSNTATLFKAQVTAIMRSVRYISATSVALDKWPIIYYIVRVLISLYVSRGATNICTLCDKFVTCRFYNCMNDKNQLIFFEVGMTFSMVCELTCFHLSMFNSHKVVSNFFLKSCKYCLTFRVIWGLPKCGL